MRQVFLDAYEHGITRFITGMAVGFDMLAAEVVLSMKGICPGLTHRQLSLIQVRQRGSVTTTAVDTMLSWLRLMRLLS